MSRYPHPMRHYLTRLLTWEGNPWHLASFGVGSMAQLHRLAGRYALVEHYGRWAWCIKLLLTLTWPIRLTAQTRPLLRQFSKLTTIRHGVSLWRQVIDLAWLGLGFGLPPLAYYQLQLFLPTNRPRLADYLYDHEVNALFPCLNGFRHDLAVDDKRLFGERCGAFGLASVPLLAWAQYGKLQGIQDRWPTDDLISKPAVGYQGKGVELWRATSPGHYSRDGCVSMNRDQLLQWLAHADDHAAWLLQPALKNHADLADLSAGPLVTVRIMTARDNSGHCEDFAAVLKIPLGGQVISNHGLGCAIDLQSGALGAAYPYQPLHPGFHVHPDTGAPITGRVLPDWAAARQLARAAHALFPAMRLLGWDVALTPDGPVLLETNAGWDVTMPQIAMQRPLGDTNLPDLCARMIPRAQRTR